MMKVRTCLIAGNCLTEAMVKVLLSNGWMLSSEMEETRGERGSRKGEGSVLQDIYFLDRYNLGPIEWSTGYPALATFTGQTFWVGGRQ